MAKTQVSIRIDLETGARIGPGKIALFGGDQQNRVHHGSRAINEYVLS
jgi:hypothetical protein